MLENKYFVVKSCEAIADGYCYHIELNANHPVYEGHFPGSPVSPGVCSIEMIKECVEKIYERQLTLVSISQCRFINVLTPDKGDDISINITSSLEETNVKVVASIVDTNDTVYVTFKGDFIIK